MRRLDLPPSSPPVITIDGKTIPPASFDWWSDGKPMTFRAASNQDDVVLVTANIDDAVSIKTSTSVRPSQAVVSVFTSDMLDGNGIPLGAISHEANCLDPNNESCVIRSDEGSIAFIVRPNKDAKILVLHLNYFLLENGKDSTEGHILTGSWGVRANK